MQHHPRRIFLARVAASTLGVSCLGCGTLLHPERKGQTGGQIDWRIAALDGAGMLLFFVPGVIAFAVDFYHGTIFLPSTPYARIDTHHEQQLASVPIPSGTFSNAVIEDVVSQHVGQKVQLQAGQYCTTPLKIIDQFWPEAAKLQGLHDQTV